MSLEIKIELARVNAKPPLRAQADVTLEFSNGAVTIRRCPIFEREGAPPWASLPRLAANSKGKMIFAPLVELPRDLERRVFSVILKKYEGLPG